MRDEDPNGALQGPHPACGEYPNGSPPSIWEGPQWDPKGPHPRCGDEPNGALNAFTQHVGRTPMLPQGPSPKMWGPSPKMWG